MTKQLEAKVLLTLDEVFDLRKALMIAAQQQIQPVRGQIITKQMEQRYERYVALFDKIGMDTYNMRAAAMLGAAPDAAQ